MFNCWEKKLNVLTVLFSNVGSPVKLSFRSDPAAAAITGDVGSVPDGIFRSVFLHCTHSFEMFNIFIDAMEGGTRRTLNVNAHSIARLRKTARDIFVVSSIFPFLKSENNRI